MVEIVGKREIPFGELFDLAIKARNSLNNWFVTTNILEDIFERKMKFGGDISSREISENIFRILLSSAVIHSDFKKLFTSEINDDNNTRNRILEVWIPACKNRTELMDLLESCDFIESSIDVVDFEFFIRSFYKRLDEIVAIEQSDKL